jgi:hypothetical protein
VRRKFHIRGALTTGIKWYFVVVDLDPNGDSAESCVSDLIEWRWNIKRGPTSKERIVEETSDEVDPALIAGILSIQVSILDPVVSSTPVFIVVRFQRVLQSDQWFVQSPTTGGV